MPEPQTVRDCAALREACRDAIFSKMDEQHGETLDALADIRVKIAEERGRRDSREEIPAAKRFPWREVGAIIILAAGAIAAGVAAVLKVLP